MEQRHGRVSDALLIFFVVLLCLFAGELILRQWFPLDTVILQPDKRYLYKFIENSRQLVRPVTASGAPEILVTINRQGRRGELLDRDQKHRIVVYGDSFIAAENTPLRQTFVSQFQRLIGAKLGQRVQVLNAGVPGYGPDQASLVMEDEIDSIKPSLVVFAVYAGNDFGDLVRNKLFKLDEQGRLIPNHPTLDANLVLGFEGAYKQQPSVQTIRRAKAVMERLKVRLHKVDPGADGPQLPSPRALLEAWANQSRREYMNYALEHDNQVHNLFLDGYDLDISTAPRSDSSRCKVALMGALIERIQGIAARRSVPVIFLIIPSPIDVLDRWDVSIDSSQYPEYRRSALTDAVEGIAKDRGVYYLNLFAPFHTYQAENLYYQGLDDHWNATGQHLAATLMAEYIWRDRVLRTALTRD
jgi:hypothetical protein